MKKTSWLSRLLGQPVGPSSADIAKDRLTVLVASGNSRLQNRLTDETIDKMKREILDVVNRYVAGVNLDDVEIKKDKSEEADNMDILAMFINLPDKK